MRCKWLGLATATLLLAPTVASQRLPMDFEDEAVAAVEDGIEWAIDRHRNMNDGRETHQLLIAMLDPGGAVEPATAGHCREFGRGTSVGLAARCAAEAPSHTPRVLGPTANTIR